MWHRRFDRGCRNDRVDRRPVQVALRKTEGDTRIVHLVASRHFRKPLDPEKPSIHARVREMLTGQIDLTERQMVKFHLIQVA